VAGPCLLPSAQLASHFNNVLEKPGYVRTMYLPYKPVENASWVPLLTWTR
jgi:hypothetical protein